MKSLIKFPGHKVGGLIFWIGCIGGAILAYFGPIMMWILLVIPAAVALPFYIKSAVQRRHHRRLLRDGTSYEACILRLETYSDTVFWMLDMLSSLFGGPLSVDDWVCVICTYRDKFGKDLTIKSPMFRHKSGFADGLNAKVYVDDYNSDRYTVEVLDTEEWRFKE